MKEILQSTLSDKEKFEILRLDYPDRSNQDDMNNAHHRYRDKIRSSKLPSAMKNDLLKDVQSKFDQYCALM
jgi:hypothetical protein